MPVGIPVCLSQDTSRQRHQRVTCRQGKEEVMGNNERMYIRNLAITLMGQLKVDQQMFQRWENFPPIISPGRAMHMHCRAEVSHWLRKCNPETLGKIGAFGRQHQIEFPSASTTLHDVLGDEGLDVRDWGGTLLSKIACATILAEMTDILLERLTPEERFRFYPDKDPNLADEGIEPSRGRHYRHGDDGAFEPV